MPRFKASVGKSILWRVDNTSGTKDITHEVTTSTGVVSSTSTTKSLTLGFEQSISASMEADVFFGSVEMSVSANFKQELSEETATSNEFSRSTEKKYTFVAPAGKIYEVAQLHADFRDYHGDSFGFNGKEIMITEK